MAIKKGQTFGKVRNVLGVARMYYKPTMGRFVIRKPGVTRRSEKVLERNRVVKANPPAAKCKGKPWHEFVACLSEHMPK